MVETPSNHSRKKNHKALTGFWFDAHDCYEDIDSDMFAKLKDGKTKDQEVAAAKEQC